jgi:hypothetical protein
MTPPNIGATEGAWSFRITVNQNTIALYAMSAPPITNNATANMNCGQFISASLRAGYSISQMQKWHGSAA